MTNLEQFKKDKVEAFSSLDEEKIRAFDDKYAKVLVPYKGLLFWVVVHKAVTASTDIDIEIRRASKKWLTDNNFRSLDDGEL